MKFRPCIDLHEGKVKQIVGGSLTDKHVEQNFVSKLDSTHYAELYKRDQLRGGHIIQLGKGNREAALSALRAYPGGLQIGGGITAENAEEWLSAGAEKVIVTSYLFPEDKLSTERLKKLSTICGKDKLVIDLSCRKKQGYYYVVKDRWQTFTNFVLNEENIKQLENHCAELLIHAVDVEGKQQGLETSLVKNLSEWVNIPMTYAGGIHTKENIDNLLEYSGGRFDFTVGSALDIFGGQGLSYDWLKKNYSTSTMFN